MAPEVERKEMEMPDELIHRREIALERVCRAVQEEDRSIRTRTFGVAKLEASDTSRLQLDHLAIIVAAGSLEPLSKQHMLMTLWIIRNAGHDLESETLIEPWRLKAVGRQENLPAASFPRLFFCRFDQRFAEAMATRRSFDPDLPDLAAATPGVPA